jgi:hypothetical protein
MKVFFECYDVSVRVRLDDESFSPVLEWLGEDFKHFVQEDDSSKTADLTLEIKKFKDSERHQKKIPRLFHTKMCKAYGFFQRTCVYDSKHLLRMEAPGLATLWGEDSFFIYEIAWTFLVSMICEKIEKKHPWLRIHGLGLTHPKGRVVFLAPSGGGKSFLAAQALQNRGQVLSDEILWTDGKRFFPFPLRIALKKDSCETLRLTAERKFERKIFEPKHLFSLAPEDVGSPMTPHILFMGSQGKAFTLKPADVFDRLEFYWSTAWGLGLPQMREFMIRGENLFWLPRLFLRRLSLGTRLLWATPFWTLRLEKGSSQNFEKLMSWTKNSFKL